MQEITQADIDGVPPNFSHEFTKGYIGMINKTKEKLILHFISLDHKSIRNGTISDVVHIAQAICLRHIRKLAPAYKVNWRLEASINVKYESFVRDLGGRYNPGGIVQRWLMLFQAINRVFPYSQDLYTKYRGDARFFHLANQQYLFPAIISDAQTLYELDPDVPETRALLLVVPRLIELCNSPLDKTIMFLSADKWSLKREVEKVLDNPTITKNDLQVCQWLNDVVFRDSFFSDLRRYPAVNELYQKGETVSDLLDGNIRSFPFLSAIFGRFNTRPEDLKPLYKENYRPLYLGLSVDDELREIEPYSEDSLAALFVQTVNIAHQQVLPVQPQPSVVEVVHSPELTTVSGIPFSDSPVINTVHPPSSVAVPHHISKEEVISSQKDVDTLERRFAALRARGKTSPSVAKQVFQGIRETQSSQARVQDVSERILARDVQQQRRRAVLETEPVRDVQPREGVAQDVPFSVRRAVKNPIPEPRSFVRTREPVRQYTPERTPMAEERVEHRTGVMREEPQRRRVVPQREEDEQPQRRRFVPQREEDEQPQRRRFVQEEPQREVAQPAPFSVPRGGGKNPIPKPK